MAANDPSPVAEFIRTFRLRAGLSQEALAGRSGLSARAISDIERGLRPTPRLETIRMLSDALELSDVQRSELLAASRPEIRDHSAHSHAAAIPETGFSLNLPLPPTPLIGRADQVDDLASLLQMGEARLIVLTGPGGVGKTRLATEAARRSSDAFPGGAYFVDLASVADPNLVASTIARTLGIQETGDRPIRETLPLALASRPPVLLLLDNFEQVIDAASFVNELVSAAPALRVLVTSREVLRLRGEMDIAVHPLDLPDESQSADPDLLAGVPAIVLFVRTAESVHPGFALTAENAADIAGICGRLEGLPLAIEIAATRVRHFRPADLLEHLDRRLPVLTGGPRDLPARQQSVRDTIAWSYDLLDAGEQALFRQLGVFLGGASLEAIEALSTGTDRPAIDPLAILASLIDKNLVLQRVGDEGSPRYLMLELIREFATEQLRKHGEYEQARQAHAGYYLDLLRQRGQRFADQFRGFSGHAIVQSEIDNLRAAFDWCESQLDAGGCAEIANGIWHSFYIHGLYREVHARSARALELSSSRPITMEQRATLLAGQAVTESIFGNRDAAHALARESVDLARPLPEASGLLPVALICLTITLRTLHRYDEALEQAAAARDVARSTRDIYAEAHALYHLGRLRYFKDELDEAATCLEASLALIQGLEPTDTALYAMDTLAAVQIRRGKAEDAPRLLLDAYQLKQQGGFTAGLGYWLETVFLLAEHSGEHAFAARYYGYFITIWTEVGSPETWPDQDVKDALARIHRQLGGEAFDREYTAGLSLTESQAFSLGLELVKSFAAGMHQRDDR